MAHLLPGVFTTLNLFSGFYAVLSSFDGRFLNSGIAIFFALAFDVLDGRIARATHQSSKFGKEYDSLADLVSFGLAPAFLIYNFSLKAFSKVGWLACFLYTACVALRLARFNVKSSSQHFEGLPSPAGGAIIASLVILLQSLGVEPLYKNYFLLFMIYLLSYLLVSPIKYPSFKELKVKGLPAFYFLLIFVFLLILTATNTPLILFVLATIYVLLGPLLLFKNLFGNILKKNYKNRQKKGKN